MKRQNQPYTTKTTSYAAGGPYLAVAYSHYRMEQSINCCLQATPEVQQAPIYAMPYFVLWSSIALLSTTSNFMQRHQCHSRCLETLRFMCVPAIGRFIS